MFFWNSDARVRLLQPYNLALLQFACAGLEDVTISRSRAWQGLGKAKARKRPELHRKEGPSSLLLSSRRQVASPTSRRSAANADLQKKARLRRSLALCERFSPVAMKLSATCGRNFAPREGNGNARQGQAEQLPASSSSSSPGSG